MPSVKMTDLKSLPLMVMNTINNIALAMLELENGSSFIEWKDELKADGYNPVSSSWFELHVLVLVSLSCGCELSVDIVMSFL